MAQAGLPLISLSYTSSMCFPFQSMCTSNDTVNSAGTMPYVGRDMMAFPVSLPSDGLVDVSVQELVSSIDNSFSIHLKCHRRSRGRSCLECFPVLRKANNFGSHRYV